MRTNITSNPQQLKAIDGMVSVSEYIYGPRVFVNINHGEYKIYPDHEHNRKIGFDFSDKDFERFIEKFITIFRLSHAKTPRYWVCLVYFNKDILESTNVRYRMNEGMLAVSAYIDDGTPMNQELFSRLMRESGIPHNQVMYAGLLSGTFANLPRLANTSKLSVSDHAAGIIIMKEPPQHMPNLQSVENGPFEVCTYLMESSDVIKKDMGIETPGSLVQEFGNHVGPKLIDQLHNDSSINPVVNKIKFRKMCLRYLKENMSHFYEEYNRRAQAASRDGEYPFEEELYKYIRERINKVTSEMDRYKSQKGKK